MKIFGVAIHAMTDRYAIYQCEIHFRRAKRREFANPIKLHKTERFLKSLYLWRDKPINSMSLIIIERHINYMNLQTRQLFARFQRSFILKIYDRRVRKREKRSGITRPLIETTIVNLILKNLERVEGCVSRRSCSAKNVNNLIIA